MQYSIVQLSELDKSMRIDSEYYMPRYLKLNEKLEKYNTSSIGSLAKVTDGEHGSVVLRKEGIKYLTAENIKKGYVDVSNVRYVDELVDERNKRARVNVGDILVSIKGTLGEVALAEQWLLSANMNRDVAIIKVKSSVCIPEYIAIFLMCKVGKLQAERVSSGGVQKMITLERLRDVKLPMTTNVFQEKIKNIYSGFFKLRNQSKFLYAEAENLLLEELGLKDWKPKHQLTYIKYYSHIQKVNRMDAEYFQPMYDEIIGKIKNIQNTNLNNIVKWSKGIEVGSEQYTDKGFDFIRISDFGVKGINDTSKKISKALFLELKDKFSPKKGDILFTKDGTIGLTYLVNQNQNSIISSAFLKLRPKIEIESEYLALVLNSVICKKQIEMMSGGAIIAHLRPSDAMNLCIPILNSEKQKEISSKIIESKEKDQQSKSLLSIAKKAVEMTIETNEDQAIKWINEELEKLGVSLSNE